MSLWILTGINVGLALANVMIALFNVRLFRAQARYLQMQTEFYQMNTPPRPRPVDAGGSSRIRA